MKKKYNGLPVIFLTIIVGILLQVLLCLAHFQPSPHKAAVDFLQSYYQIDEDISDHLCDEIVSDEETNHVHDYMHKQKKEADDRGFTTTYLKSKLYNVKTYTLKKDDGEAQLRLVAERKYPIRSFFTGKTYEVDQILDLVKEDGKWKVCGDIFSVIEMP